MIFQRILVPLDGSALAGRAVPHAVEVARLLGSEILLLHVLEPDPVTGGSPDPLRWELQRVNAELQLQDVQAHVRETLGEPVEPPAEESGSRVQSLVVEGKTAETIVDVCNTHGIDLLVMGTHGAGGLSRFSVNSIINKVANLAYLPILIVRSYKPTETENAGVHYRRILVPLDGSRRAECALPAATAMAQVSGAALTLLSVVRPPELPASEPYVGELRELSERMTAAISKAFRAYLQEVADRQPVHAETHLVQDASVTHAIQEMASGQSADLVVLCAHGQASQGDYPYGAVARHYIHEGTTSLLIVQDIPRSQTVPTEAERAAESTRSR